jgi:hypothetical protein
MLLASCHMQLEQASILPGDQPDMLERYASSPHNS